MAVKLITLLAFLAFAASAHGYVLVTTHFNDSSCGAESKVAQNVYSPCPPAKRSIQLSACTPLSGAPDYYYITSFQCGSELEPEPVADWQLLRSTLASDCNYTAAPFWTMQVSEQSQYVYIAAFFGYIVPVKLNATCDNGVLFGEACDTNSCYPYSVGTDECKAETGLDYITQSTCAVAPVAAPVASPISAPESTPGTASPVSSPVAAPVASPNKTPAKTSSASVVAGSALFVTLLTML